MELLIGKVNVRFANRNKPQNITKQYFECNKIYKQHKNLKVGGKLPQSLLGSVAWLEKPAGCHTAACPRYPVK